MLSFSSAMTRMVNTRRALAECLDASGSEGATGDDEIIILHASMGHNLGELGAEARRLAPKARVFGASCCGVVGREGVSESMKDLAIMRIRGEVAVASVDGIDGRSSHELAARMAADVRRQAPGVNMVFLLASGIDIANDGLIEGIESVLGPEVTIFGATSSDNMKGVASYQLVDQTMMEHGAWLIGFADPSLEAVTQATHGFVAVGTPLVVTKSDGNRILELNGRPAWLEYAGRLGLDQGATTGDSIPIGALAEELPPHLAEEYGNPHILRVVTKREVGGGMYYATTCPEGTRLWLTKRDETRIFAALDSMMTELVRSLDGRSPVAVFHADCLARGRFLFNRVLKDEIVSHMQAPLFRAGVVPWLGMYGFGEFARLGGRNQFHNYTTSLCVVARRP